MVTHLPATLLAAAVLGVALPAAAQQPSAAPSVTAAMSPDLRATFTAHADAVARRDLAALERTLTATPDLTLIFPNGRRTDTRAAFIDFHRQWFADAGWTMRFDPVSVRETADTAIILVRTHFETTAEDGKVSWSESWLTLTFVREPQGWALAHDQNTRIRTSDDPGT
jgi:ketosteroid isomerase-like protein